MKIPVNNTSNSSSTLEHVACLLQSKNLIGTHCLRTKKTYTYNIQEVPGALSSDFNNPWGQTSIYKPFSSRRTAARDFYN